MNNLRQSHYTIAINFLLASTVIIRYIIFNLGEAISWITTNITTDKIPYNTFHTFHKYTPNQPFKNDFAQSFSLAFIIRKNALILYSFSEEKEVQNGLFYHFIYKILVVNWSNMLHRQVKQPKQLWTFRNYYNKRSLTHYPTTKSSDLKLL